MLSIRTKITLPFLVLCVAACGATVWVGVTVTASAVEESLQKQASDMAGVLAKAGLPLGPALLQHIRLALDAEIVVSDKPGKKILATTLGSQSLPEVERTLFEKAREWVPGRPERKFRKIKLPEGMYYATWAEAAPAGEELQRIYVLFSEDRLARAKAQAVRPLLWLSLSAVLLTILLGLALGRAIARPVQVLVQKTRQAASGNLDQKIELASGDEVQELARSFNQMLEGLKEHERKLLQAERLSSMGQIAAAMAHEIRNPLSSIKMSLQMLLRDSQLGTDHEELARTLLREVGRLELCVEELLGYAQPAPLRRTRISLKSVLEESLGLLESQFSHRAVRVGCQVEDVTVDADPVRLKQVFLNLLLNACQSMPSGGRLNVASSSSNGRVRVELTDSGTGIPAELHDKIFEPFFTTREKGTGLGLALTRRIVEEHDGRIGFQSQPGQTTFWVELPQSASP